MSKEYAVIPIFIPHKGCPFDCIYCNQKNISGQKEEVTEEMMISTIESHLNTIDGDSYVEIAFYGGSFTGIEKNEQFKFLEIAGRYIRDGHVKGIRLSTRPDYINKNILDYLREFGVSTIELGVQSLDDEILRKSCRGHNVKSVYDASNLIKDYGFTLGLQTMLGLPGDTVEKALYTANKITDIKPNILRIYPTLVIRGTYLEKMYNKGVYTPPSLNETVELCAKLLSMYRENGINVIRIGLQPTENIKVGGDVIAGPFHPAIRQLVESRIARNKIDELIKKMHLSSKNSIKICTSRERISDVVGQKRENISYFKSKYGYNKVTVREHGGACEIYDIKY